MAAPSTALQTCPLCSCSFDPSERSCRPWCPMAGRCGILCCPRCGYGFPQETRGLAGVLRRALVRLGARP